MSPQVQFRAAHVIEEWSKASSRRFFEQVIRLVNVLLYLINPFVDDFERVDLCIILGGHHLREKEALRKANTKFPRTPIWITGPALSEDCLVVCRSVGCDTTYIRVDYNALDTLSNFTTLVEDIEELGFKNVAVFTSRHHMTRAMCVATALLPAYGVKRIQKVKVRTPGEAATLDEEEESWFRVFRDLGRAIVWLLTGLDPSGYAIQFLHPDRLVHRKRRVDELSHNGRFARDRRL